MIISPPSNIFEIYVSLEKISSEIPQALERLSARVIAHIWRCDLPMASRDKLSSFEDYNLFK